jgi:hypothetical protein
MSDLIGATPVPGPTQITGVCKSGGSWRRPFWTPMRNESPDGIKIELDTEGRGQEPGTSPGRRAARKVVQTPRLGTRSFVR